jgi:hypothetical protein
MILLPDLPYAYAALEPVLCIVASPACAGIQRYGNRQ